MKLRIGLIGLLSLAALAIAFWSYLYFYKDTAYIYTPPLPAKSSLAIVNTDILPSFISLRFEDVGSKNIHNISQVTPEKFEECLKYLRDNNYHFLSSKEVYDFMVNKVTIPDKSIWLTFDEGMKSTYTYVTPLLKKYDARATVFIGIAWIRKPYRLTDNQLSDMRKSGLWDIQAHGYQGNLSYPINSKGEEGNFYLYRLWQIDRPETIPEYKNRIKKDLNAAFEYLRSNLNSEKFFFSYPFGESLSSLDYENSMARYLLECLDELNIIGIGKRNFNSITTDWSTKRHLISRYDVNEYTDLETVLSPRYTGKRVEYSDYEGNTFTFSNITRFDQNTLLCWDDKCNFIFADNYYNPQTNIKNLSDFFAGNLEESSETMKKALLVTILPGDTIFIVDADNKSLLRLSKDWVLEEKHSLEFSPVSIWNDENEIFLLDKAGTVYRFTGKPHQISNFNSINNPVRACAFGDIVYMIDDKQKKIYVADYINNKLLQTKNFSQKHSIIPQFCIKAEEFIAWDANNGVLVKVEIR